MYVQIETLPVTMDSKIITLRGFLKEYQLLSEPGNPAKLLDRAVYGNLLLPGILHELWLYHTLYC